MLAAARPLNDSAEKISSAGSENVSAANNDRSGPSRLCTALTVEFRGAVHAQRIWLIALRVEPVLFAVEHVISRDRNQQRAKLPASQGEHLGSACIGHVRALFIELAAIDVAPGCAIDHHLRLVGFQRVHHTIRIADIECLVIIGEDKIPNRATMVRDRSSYHSAGARY